MTTTSDNLLLTLWDSTTDLAVTFSSFRLQLAGPSLTSNLSLIDTWAGTVNTNIANLLSSGGVIPVSATYISANYYEATVSTLTDYTTGATIALTLNTTSNGNVTLKINSLATKYLKKRNSAGTIVDITGKDLFTGKTYLFQYDGTQWVWVSVGNAMVDIVSATHTSGDTGVRGEVSYDATYVYFCVDTNTWIRLPITAW